MNQGMAAEWAGLAVICVAQEGVPDPREQRDQEPHPDTAAGPQAYQTGWRRDSSPHHGGYSLLLTVHLLCARFWPDALQTTAKSVFKVFLEQTCGTVAGPLPSTHEALGSILSTRRRKEEAFLFLFHR